MRTFGIHPTTPGGRPPRVASQDSMKLPKNMIARPAINARRLGDSWKRTDRPPRKPKKPTTSAKSEKPPTVAPKDVSGGIERKAANTAMINRIGAKVATPATTDQFQEPPRRATRAPAQNGSSVRDTPNQTQSKGDIPSGDTSSSTSVQAAP